MTISELSIKRPVLATVMTIVIFLFGIIGYTFLGVREFPSVDPPIISVQASYPGANPEVIANQITEPLEQNINGIQGIRTLTSVSSQGSSRITVEFELGVDMEAAANDVRDKVSRAQRLLPRDCDPPIVSKADADSSPILGLAIASEKRSLLEIGDIAELTVKERLQTIKGVSAVNFWGQKRYAMRLWLDPVKMAGYGVTPIDVSNAVRLENVELPSGKIEGNTIELSIRTMGLMTTAKEFNDLIIKESTGRIVRFSDIGWAELGPEDIRSTMTVNGRPSTIVMVVPQPGSNQIEIADEVYKRVDEMKKDLPEDVELTYVFDNTRFVRASISEVQQTIYIAFLLVIVIIFLFLRDWRVTLIPVTVIPVSLVGAFFVMYIAGFSINVLTLLAIVLAVGLVVDDAIVVAENIYVKIENGMDPIEAGMEGSREIFFAVIATTITLVAVFFPIVFLQGITGRLFREFSIVIAGAVVISSFVALTFTPMLATKLLKRKAKRNLFYSFTEPFFEGMNHYYRVSLEWVIRNRWLAIVIMTITIGSIYYLWNEIPSEMAPLEDRSQMSISARGAEGITYEYMRDYISEVTEEVNRMVPEARFVQMMASGSTAFIRVSLVDIGERERTQQEIAQSLSGMLRTKTSARASVQQQSTFGGRRSGLPVQYVLQAPNIGKLAEILPVFMDKVQSSPVFQMADVDLRFNRPEIRIEIDRDKAAMLGVSTQTIAQTLQIALSGQRIGYFYMNGKQYQILGEINRTQRNKPIDLKSIYVRNNRGEMIQMDNVVSTFESVAPPSLYRYNRFVSATVSSGLAPGRTIGHGLEEMDRIAKEVLGDDFRTALAGDSKDFRESASSLMFAFILALVLIYLVLSAQFESFKDPMIIMFTVPLALAGALIFLYLKGQTMNIFSQIGIIMLVGLVAKNGILIVEFANQRKLEGLSTREAIIDAATQRLRPILMTSISTILGILPLAFAVGEGKYGRIAMGTAVMGGLLISTFFTLYVVPAIYSYISTEKSKRSDQ